MTHASAAGSPLEVPDNLVRLSVGIQLTFVVCGVLYALMDKIAAQAKEIEKRCARPHANLDKG